MKPSAVLLLASLASAVAGVTAAPRSACAETALQEARALYNKATIEYNLGKFQEALDLYTKAYERMQKPALLFDIGQCHRLLGHYEQAMFFYQGFLREAPNAPNRAAAEQHIAEAQRALDDQRAKRQEIQRQAAQASAQPAPAAPEPQPEPAVPPPRAPAPAGPPAAPAPAVLRIAGLATAGVGAVLVGVGAGLGIHANSLSSELSQVSSQHGTWTAQDQSDFDSGKSSATAATVFCVLGATAVVTGAVMTWLGWPKSHAQVGALVAPAAGGVGMSGVF
jgi:tetratricopeptide (TPR) repeat protein